MRVYLGADHRGFERKEQVKHWLAMREIEVIDAGADEFITGDDYIDYALKIFREMNFDMDRALLFCGSGHGMEIVANRHTEVRAILGFNKTVAKQGRMHENANVMTIATDWVGEREALEIVEAFLTTEYGAEARHVRRLEKIEALGK